MNKVTEKSLQAMQLGISLTDTLSGFNLSTDHSVYVLRHFH